MECLNRLMVDHPVFGVGVGVSVGGASGGMDGAPVSSYLQQCEAR
jgi:NCAIR mutase (PurE)-related protein